MLTFTTVQKRIEVSFQEESEIILCPRCTSPNKTDEGYCVDCGAPLHTSPRTRFALAKDVRQCNMCSHYNRRKDKVCANKQCAADLSQEQHVQKTGDSTEIRYVKVCPGEGCGHTNPANANVCEVCGRSLDFVDPLEEFSFSSENDKMIEHVLFINVRTGERAKLQFGEQQIIGYNHFLGDFMKACDYVGNSHADITWVGKDLYITDHSRNGTYINGVRIKSGERTKLCDESIIGLGDSSLSEPLAAFYKIEYHVH